MHRSTGELERAILDDIDTVNADPKPFRWTKSADDILATIKRFCLTTLQIAETQREIIRTSESGQLPWPDHRGLSLARTGLS